MLFSITPKSRRDELYNLDSELDDLVKNVKINPMTIVIGMRRTGKLLFLKLL